MKTSARRTLTVIAIVGLLGLTEGLVNRALDIDPAAPPPPAPQVVDLVSEPTPEPTTSVPAELAAELAEALAGEVPPGMAESLAEEPGQADRNWTLCDFYLGDTSYIVCPDGYWVSS